MSLHSNLLMKILFLVVALLSTLNVVLAVTASSKTVPIKRQVTLVQNGISRCAIYVAPSVMAVDVKLEPAATFAQTDAETQRRRLRDSVNDLALYLKKISGAEVRVLQRPPTGGEKVLPILIGDYAVKKFGVIKNLSPYKQGFRVVVAKSGVGLMGQSDEATSYAIYEVLDRLGCRWFMPSEMGESVPLSKTIKLNMGDVTSAPATACRNVWYSDEAFKRRNRLGGFAIQAGHALEFYITKEQREQHPGWKAIIGGKPSDLRLKWSNPEVSNAVADAIIARLDKSYEPSISLSPDDGATFDESGDTKWDAGDWDPSMNQVSITDRYVHFCNLVAERVTKKYPDVRLGFLAYVQYTRPPVREKLHPNLVPMIAPITYCRAHAMTDTHICPSRPQMRHIVEGWGKAAKQVSYYNYMFHLAEVSVPYPMMHQMKAELPILYANNVAFWQPETLPDFESILPGMWLTLRMSWNPKLNSDAVLNEFFTRFYGEAEKPMRLYWQTFDDAWTKVPEHAGMDAGYARRFTPGVLARARSAMNAAMKAAKTPVVKSRVKMQDDALKQFELLMQMKWDLNGGKLADLDVLSERWLNTQARLGEEYSKQYAFTKIPWQASKSTLAAHYFNILFGQPYGPGGRIAREFQVVTPPLRNWKYAVDKDRVGETNNWQTQTFNDANWKTTDLALDNWFDLGLADYYGPVWYRAKVKVPAGGKNKKTFLWIPSEDGDVKLFINGKLVPYVNARGEISEQFKGGFCTPISFDITSFFKPGEENDFALIGTRTFLNELGTGGLMSPLYLYQEK